MKNPYRAAGSFTGEAYIERDADRVLLTEIAKNTRYPYVLAPRQSGKSSLIAHVMSSLLPPKYHCCFVDIQGLRRGASGSYSDFLAAWSSALLRDRNSLTNADAANPKLALQRLLSLYKNRVIIFLDEIDYLRGVDFKDDFFGLIRSFYNQRALEPTSGFDRLQFVLSGAAQPSELIEKANHSPFNVGVPIVLGDLSVTEISAMLRPMVRRFAVHPTAARRLHLHTNGSVYLTQLILEQMWNKGGALSSERLSPTEIDEVVSDIVLNATSDIHFLNIHRSTGPSVDRLAPFTA